MITLDNVRDIFDYDPVAGCLVWKARQEITRGDRGFNKRCAGKPAGTVSHNGYVNINFQKACYLAHRLIWMHVHGIKPEQAIDHIDRDRSNNRLSNLRVATFAQNLFNSEGRVRKFGVSISSGGKLWRSQITIDKKRKYLGTFPDQESAAEAYRQAARSHYGEFAAWMGEA